MLRFVSINYNVNKTPPPTAIPIMNELRVCGCLFFVFNKLVVLINIKSNSKQIECGGV